jgi:hypothetical protein
MVTYMIQNQWYNVMVLSVIQALVGFSVTNECLPTSVIVLLHIPSRFRVVECIIASVITVERLRGMIASLCCYFHFSRNANFIAVFNSFNCCFKNAAFNSLGILPSTCQKTPFANRENN